MVSFQHNDDVTDRRAASVLPTCGCSFFIFSVGLVRVCEIRLSHIDKNHANPDLACENYNIL